MKAVKIILGIVVVVAAVLVLSATMPEVKSLFVNSKSVEVVYVNPANGASISISYDNSKKTATLNSQSFKGVEFVQIESASGARYENAEQKLMIWNKGDEVILYQNALAIFSGKVQVEEAQ